MAGRVDQVELVLLAVLGGVHHADSMGLNRDSTFTLKIHRVQYLRLHFALSHRAGELKETIGKRGFSVVNMRDDREISDVLTIH